MLKGKGTQCSLSFVHCMQRGGGLPLLPPAAQPGPRTPLTPLHRTIRMRISRLAMRRESSFEIVSPILV